MPFPIIPVAAFFGGLLATAGLAALSRGEKAHQRLLRELQRGESRTVAAVRGRAVARVVGTIEPAERLVTAPLSGASCVAWELSAWHPLGRLSWRRVGFVGDHVPFAVRDSTGRARVMVDRVQSYGVVDHEERFAGVHALPEPLRALIAERGLLGELETGRLLHLKESKLEVGEVAVIVGQVKRDDGEAARVGYRDSARLTEVVLTAPPGTAVLFSDAPEAVDPRAPRAAR